MSARYSVSPAALDDIDEIADWMWHESPGTDRDLRFIEAAYVAFESIAQRPGIGHRRPDLTDRRVLFKSLLGSFAIVYRTQPKVEIVYAPLATRFVAVT